MALLAKQVSAAKKKKFLACLKSTGNISEAARFAKVNRLTPYNWREADPAFAKAWEEALDEYADRLEKEADRRAVEGWLEPVFYEGEECGHKRKFSDTLLIFRLKALRPEKYRERVETEVKGLNITAYLGNPPADGDMKVNLGEEPQD